MYQNIHFLNHFFALLDFGRRDEERRAKNESELLPVVQTNFGFL